MAVTINLLPWREEQKERLKKEFLIILAMAVVCALTILGFVHFCISHKIDHQRQNNEILQSEIRILDKQIAQIKTLQEEKAELIARMDIIQQLQTNRPHVVRLFDGITKTVPDGLFLDHLERRNINISIEGRAESNTRVSTFMRNIDASNWLKSPVLSVIQADDTKANSKNSAAKSDKSQGKWIGFNLQAVQVMQENNHGLSD